MLHEKQEIMKERSENQSHIIKTHPEHQKSNPNMNRSKRIYKK